MLLSKYKREPEAWNKHVVSYHESETASSSADVVPYYESEATSSSADTAHHFRLIPWLLELDSGKLSHPYMTTGKTIALTRQTFVGKVISLFVNMLSSLAISFLLRSKRLLISWVQSPSAVILEPPKMKSDTVSTISPSISHEVIGPDAMIFVFWMLSFKSTFYLSSFHFHQEAF